MDFETLKDLIEIEDSDAFIKKSLSKYGLARAR